MINEVYVIQNSGIPLYYYNYEQLSSNVEITDSTSTLQAGFFAAIVQFGSELAQDELRYIVFNNRTYGIKRSNDIYVVFSENVPLSVEQLKELDKKLSSATAYLSSKFGNKPLDIAIAVNEKAMDKLIGGFSDFLVEEQIIQQEVPLDKTKLKTNLRNFIFKSIGYEPGKCNIGKRERMKRFAIGLISITIGLVLFAIILLAQWPAWTVFLLMIPFSMGFVGFYQYFFRFCVSNALTKQFNMN